MRERERDSYFEYLSRESMRNRAREKRTNFGKGNEKKEKDTKKSTKREKLKGKSEL